MPQEWTQAMKNNINFVKTLNDFVKTRKLDAAFWQTLFEDYKIELTKYVDTFAMDEFLPFVINSDFEITFFKITEYNLLTEIVEAENMLTIPAQKKEIFSRIDEWPKNKSHPIELLLYLRTANLIDQRNNEKQKNKKITTKEAKTKETKEAKKADLMAIAKKAEELNVPYLFTCYNNNSNELKFVNLLAKRKNDGSICRKTEKFQKVFLVDRADIDCSNWEYYCIAERLLLSAGDAKQEITMPIFITFAEFLIWKDLHKFGGYT